MTDKNTSGSSGFLPGVALMVSLMGGYPMTWFLGIAGAILGGVALSRGGKEMGKGSRGVAIAAIILGVLGAGLVLCHSEIVG